MSSQLEMTWCSHAKYRLLDLLVSQKLMLANNIDCQMASVKVQMRETSMNKKCRETWSIAMKAKTVFGRNIRKSMKNKITARMNRGKERGRGSLAQYTVLSVSVHWDKQFLFMKLESCFCLFSKGTRRWEEELKHKWLKDKECCDTAYILKCHLDCFKERSILCTLWGRYVHLLVQYSRRPEEGTGSSGAGVRGVCFSLTSVLRTEPESYARKVLALHSTEPSLQP